MPAFNYLNDQTLSQDLSFSTMVVYQNFQLLSVLPLASSCGQIFFLWKETRSVLLSNMRVISWDTSPELFLYQTGWWRIVPTHISACWHCCFCQTNLKKSNKRVLIFHLNRSLWGLWCSSHNWSCFGFVFFCLFFYINYNVRKCTINQNTNTWTGVNIQNNNNCSKKPLFL